MRSLFHKALTLFIFSSLFISCQDEGEPNYQYMPDMYESIGYETYGEYQVFENGQEAKLPVEGTIPRGWMPYDYENTPAGLANAKAGLQNPLPYTQDNLTEGKQLYTIYCAICHGDKGDGKGTLVDREKILGVPSYDDVGRAITEGSVYHVMYYGINNMGSYASQTSIKERWQIDHYVMSLKDKLEGKPEREYVEEDGSSNLFPSEANAEIYGEAQDSTATGAMNQQPENNQTETEE